MNFVLNRVTEIVHNSYCTNCTLYNLNPAGNSKFFSAMNSSGGFEHYGPMVNGLLARSDNSLFLFLLLRFMYSSLVSSHNFPLLFSHTHTHTLSLSLSVSLSRSTTSSHTAASLGGTGFLVPKNMLLRLDYVFLNKAFIQLFVEGALVNFLDLQTEDIFNMFMPDIGLAQGTTRGMLMIDLGTVFLFSFLELFPSLKLFH